MAVHLGIGSARNDDDSGVIPIDVRKDLEGMFARPGVLPGSASPLVVGSAGWAYTVKGPAWWVTKRAAGDGVQVWGNDGDVSVATSTTAPGAGLSRIDIIYVRHLSNGENSDVSTAGVIGVASGMPGSSPSAPSIPPGALEIARNTMTSAATSTASTGNTIEQTAAITTTNGGFFHAKPGADLWALASWATAERSAVALLGRGLYTVTSTGDV